jgi:azurin
MRTLLAILVLLSIPPWAAAQVSVPPRVIIQDEGTLQGTARILNCVGAGLTCAVSGTTATFTAAGGGGSSNVVAVTITITDNVVGLVYTAAVTGQAWVTAASIIACGVFADGSGSTPVELVAASGAHVVAHTRVVATGFSVSLYNPNGVKGTFLAHCTGV